MPSHRGVALISRRIFQRSGSSNMAMSDVRQFVHRPGGSLRRYVREILWIRSEHSRIQVLLPETTLTLVLRQSGAASLHNENLPNTVVSGLQKRTRIIEHTAGSSLIIVRFTEVGAPAILHERVDLLYDQTVPLDARSRRRRRDRQHPKCPRRHPRDTAAKVLPGPERFPHRSGSVHRTESLRRLRRQHG